jgi:hypothetical protein
MKRQVKHQAGSLVAIVVQKSGTQGVIRDPTPYFYITDPAILAIGNFGKMAETT